jgi:hypothetical protein
MTGNTEVNRPPRANRSSFVEHLVQTQWVCHSESSKLFLFSQIQIRCGVPNDTVVVFALANSSYLTTFHIPDRLCSGRTKK